MAWTVTPRVNSSSGTSSAASVTTASFTATADSLVVFAGAGELDTFDGTPTAAAPTTGDAKTFIELLLLDGADAPVYGTPGVSNYPVNSVLAYFVEDASPVSRTVSWTPGATPAINGWDSIGAFDITGFNPGAPVVGTPRENIVESQNGSNTVQLSLDMVDAFVVGNLVVVAFTASADSGGGFAAPTCGTRPMTQVWADNTAYCQLGVWYRVIDGTETNTTITCTDLGQSVGGGGAMGVQFAAATGGATIPDAPTGVSATPGDGQVDIDWTDETSGDPTPTYTIERKTGAGLYGALVSGIAQGTGTYNDATAVNGTAYTYRIRATNSEGDSAWVETAQVTPLGVPGAPTIGTATAGDGTATANWSAPASNGGSAITGYLVERNANGAGFTTLVANTGTTATSYVDNSAVNGTSYTYRVSAINAVGTGAASAASNAVVPSAAATAPGAPTAVVAQPGDGKAMVWWTAPASNGGSAITGYLVERNVNGGGWVTAVANTGTARDWCFDSAAGTVGQTVQYRVSAINGIGTGSASTVSTGVALEQRLFPTTIEAGGRYFNDQNGAPIFLAGDTAWSASAMLDRDGMRTYLDNIVTGEFNFTLISAPEPYYTDATPADENIEGDRPFTGTPYQSTLNVPYWELVEFFVRYAEVKGVYCMVTPAYIGYTDTDGWGDEITAASNAQMATVGTAIEALVSGPNVGYLAGHDRPFMTTAHKDRNKALCDELTGFLFPGSQFDVDPVDQMGAWIPPYTAGDFAANGTYNYDMTVVDDVLTVWATGKMAAWFEGRYEYENSGADNLDLRHQSWGAFVAGGAWTLFGNNPRWGFGSSRIASYGGSGSVAASYTSDGTVHQGVFAQFIAGLTHSWAAMIPDTTGTLLTAGASTGTNRAGVRYSDDQAVLYMPTQRAVTFDLSVFAAGWDDVTITRVDPASGATTLLGTYATTLTGQVIAGQGSNSDGAFTDWALLIEGNTPAVRNLYMGANQVTRVYKGANLADRVYLGSTLVFE